MSLINCCNFSFSCRNIIEDIDHASNVGTTYARNNPTVPQFDQECQNTYVDIKGKRVYLWRTDQAEAAAVKYAKALIDVRNFRYVTSSNLLPTFIAFAQHISYVKEIFLIVNSITLGMYFQAKRTEKECLNEFAQQAALEYFIQNPNGQVEGQPNGQIEAQPNPENQV